jgi:hypothetical protein
METPVKNPSLPEPLLTVAEVAAHWNLSVGWTRELFENEPGVVIFGSNGHRKWKYRTMRIPRSVVERVQKRLSRA